MHCASILTLASAALGAQLAAGPISPLMARGYTTLPAPQTVTLSGGDFEFNSRWRVAVEEGVSSSDVALETLTEGLRTRCHLVLHPPSARKPATPAISLAIHAKVVAVGPATDRNTDALAAQAYELTLAPDRIRILANAPPGLFYGVQTLLQLLKPAANRWWLPEGTIVDWPDLEMRILYRDDAHHVERLEVLEAALRQAAFFKINGFALKLEGHFQYSSVPAVVEPYALSQNQLQKLTEVALRHHIQLIPYLDAPAHDAFILKHPVYRSLRAFPNCNYEFCVVNPGTYQLLFSLFDDLLAANRGARYFVLSTDEPYYVGLPADSSCDEASRARQLGGVGSLLAEFISRCANYLHDRGRTVLFWGEYPLRPGDIPALPSHVINAETYGPEFDPVFQAHGIRQMIYTSTQGEEPLFPNYYPLPATERLHPAEIPPGRIEEMSRTITSNSVRQQADLMGAFIAGWADAGLHPETFWLGYATGTAFAWHRGAPEPAAAVNAFATLFYGPDTVNPARLYQLMSEQAGFWEDSWERGPSRARSPIFGNSRGRFTPPRPAVDQTLPPLPVPEMPSLRLSHDWTEENMRRLQLAEKFRLQNDELLELLHLNLRRAQFNRYGLEVFLSIARLCRENLDFLRDLGQINQHLRSAQNAAETDPRAAVAALDEALDLANGIWPRLHHVLGGVVSTWYGSWQPRVAQANGRRYLNQVDDVKDHAPVRTVDMSYLVYRELLYPLGEWTEAVRNARNEFARTHHLALRRGKLEWKGNSWPVANSEPNSPTGKRPANRAGADPSRSTRRGPRLRHWRPTSTSLPSPPGWRRHAPLAGVPAKPRSDLGVRG